MTAFDRNAALERRQIDEISGNVTRRLLKVLEKVRFVPPDVAADIEPGARAITAIQTEIDQIMGALPPYEMLDIAVLTHVLSSQQHALSVLEHLEARIADARHETRPPADPARAHAALLAAAREIEEEARRYAEEEPPWPAVPSRAPRTWPDWSGLAPPGPPAARRPPGSAGPPASRRRPGKRARPGPRVPGLVASLDALRARLAGHAANARSGAAVAGLAVVTGLVLAVLSLVPTGDDNRTQQQAAAALAPEEKGGGRIEQFDVADAGAAPPTGGIQVALGHPAAPPAMEQPYLVVLSTRASPEELLQDFRAFKAEYPKLLGEAKGRVDRVHGQDGKTWHRLSLIPPQTYADAKALCSGLRAAGLSGCWVKPLPLGRSQQ